MQKKKGISLIVLVITIIVMIVLAGAIILSLNNAGIIEKANQAVSSTDEATVKELAQMAWAEAYADGVRKVETEGNKKGFQDRVTEALEANKIDITKYVIAITTKGVDIKEKTNAWIQDGLTLTKGEDKLTIGQTVKYTATGTDYVGEWKVLGADEAGNLLIMSAMDVITSYGLGVDTLQQAQIEWQSECVVKLDSQCKIYGKGTGAISARCINIEDINKITEYDKTTYLPTSIYKYGNEITYIYNGTINPKYEGNNGVTGTLTTGYSNGFYWYDKEGFHKVTVEELTNTDNIGKKIAMLTNTYYYYEGSATGKLTVDSEAYKMLFGTSDNYNYYWIATPYVLTAADHSSFGIFSVYNGGINGGGLWYSTGEINNPIRGIRAVVTISSDLPLEDLI